MDYAQGRLAYDLAYGIAPAYWQVYFDRFLLRPLIQTYDVTTLGAWDDAIDHQERGTVVQRIPISCITASIVAGMAFCRPAGCASNGPGRPGRSPCDDPNPVFLAMGEV